MTTLPGSTAAQDRLTAWLYVRGADGYKVEFETDWLLTMEGKRRAWWCEVYSVFGAPGARAEGRDMEAALHAALDVLGASRASASPFERHAVSEGYPMPKAERSLLRAAVSRIRGGDS